eukprot:CAMPEP_0170554600 /NCGR_PEP_ID=MMETSP0211-20121228/12467_1 /TAXON_ID=311385 /ORGANISM="Pseudokeronopsis sp., Strain OXSARD2" /LENGTH=74 /DNA_ID=CAMNT_0010863805 /DNA_START=115 /DNA_END=339 /DNA_ORIENTATION=-
MQIKGFELEFRREAKILRSLCHPYIIKMVKNSLDEEREMSIPGLVEDDRPSSGGDSRNSGKSNGSSGEEQEPQS